MHRSFFTLAVAAPIASGPAFAQQSQSQTQPNQPAPTIDERRDNRQDRIANGLCKGTMTVGEAARVENREPGISEQNGASRQIYRDKHNGK